MNPNSKGARRTTKGMRLWTHARALAALPYVAPVLRSLREHCLEVRAHRLRAKRLTARPGKPTRAAIIALQEAQQEVARASAAYSETLKELQTLEITCLDPIRGEALFPFSQKKKVGFYLFDLFDEQPLRFWRFQDDPVDVKRPIAGSEEPVS